VTRVKRERAEHRRPAEDDDAHVHADAHVHTGAHVHADTGSPDS
jgi:hypothetical protein